MLELTHTGRVRFTRHADAGGADRTVDPAAGDAHVIGAIKWTNGEPADLAARRRQATGDAEAAWRELRDGLADEPAERTGSRLDAIATAVVHMAPVLLYVGDRTYSNLGRLSNLPGKSFALGQLGCVLSALARNPVHRWRLEDACLIACLGALLASGPPVRVEEFNGTQLDPARLEEFLRDRLAEYGERVPARSDAALGAWLDRLAGACAEARARALCAGAVAYRTIHGLNLHKRERLMRTPLRAADVPEQLRAFVAARAGAPLPGTNVPIEGAPAITRLADHLAATAATAGFSSGLEEFLHAFLTTAAEAFAADVAMSRGPRSFSSLRAEPAAATNDPLALRTNDFYCCVTPRAAFVERFADERGELVRCLSAYSARMRYNTWHYLPHTLGLPSGGTGKRSDWFFAPTMPDLTDWSDQHHTGHVDFGVRHAIRVPFGVTVDGRDLPGIYDLRLMRTAQPAFTLGDLRCATASGMLLRQIYQAMVRHRPAVSDFSNSWYRSRYG